MSNPESEPRINGARQTSDSKCFILPPLPAVARVKRNHESSKVSTTVRTPNNSEEKPGIGRNHELSSEHLPDAASNGGYMGSPPPTATPQQSEEAAPYLAGARSRTDGFASVASGVEIKQVAVNRQLVHAEAVRANRENDAAAGFEMVRRGHCAIFHEANGNIIIQNEQKAGFLVAALKQLGEQRADLDKKLRNTPRYADEPLSAGTRPLTAARLVAFLALVLVAGAALWLDMFACASALQNSGIALFVADPWKAWAVSSAPAMLSLIGKAMLGRVSPNSRKPLVILLGLAAFSCSICWVWQFSHAVPAMGQSVSDILADFDTSGGTDAASRLSSGSMVFLQVLAGSLGAIVILDQACHLLAGHQLVRRSENAAYTTTANDLRTLMSEIEAKTAELGRVKGILKHLEATLTALLIEAESHYHAMRLAVA